jgi:hypothetical protein
MQLKPLIWTQDFRPNRERADTPLGSYNVGPNHVDKFSWFCFSVSKPVICDSLEEAKQACFEHYKDCALLNIRGVGSNLSRHSSCIVLLTRSTCELSFGLPMRVYLWFFFT